MMSEFVILDCLVKMAPLINQFTQADMGVAVCDREKMACLCTRSFFRP